MHQYTPQALSKAKSLRQSQTDAEILLWKRLRNRQLCSLKFRRQVPIGHYIVDFYCHSAGLVIELDGGQHLDRQAYDEIRSHALEALGLTVLRFWNDEVLRNADGVLEHVLAQAGCPSP